MLIGSSADWHIDGGMDNDVRDSVLQMSEVFKEKAVKVIVLPGDLFHQKSTADGRNLLRELLQILGEIAPVVICYGNHDQAGDLDIFRHLKTTYSIDVFDSPRQLMYEDVVIHVMPWFTKATWQSSNIGRSIESGDIEVSKIGLQFLKNSVNQASMRHPDRKQILAAHIMIEGSKAENHQPMIGEGIRLGRHDLMEAGFHAGIFGHIHLRQTFDDIGPFFYNGSPAPMNYGESPEKYFSILDTKTLEIEWHKLNTVDRFSIELEYGLEMQAKLDEIKDRIGGARVRVTIQIPEGEDTGNIKSSIEKFLQDNHAFECKVEHQTLPKELYRSVEIRKAATLPEKLEAYWEAAQNRPEDAVAEGMFKKLTELEAVCQ